MNQRVFDIRIKGEMSPRLRDAFEDVDISVDRSVTRLRVRCNDMSALHGILARVESFGLELLGVHPIDDMSTP